MKVQQPMTIRFRPTGQEDLDFVLRVEQDPENRAFVGQWTREQHAAALEDRDIAHLIIEQTADKQRVGYIILAGLANVNQSIEFRRIVVTEKGQGYGRAALRLVKQFAFEELGAHRLWLDVKDHNTRAQHVYQAEGFVVEGTLRECLKAGERFESLIVMSMLQTEYHRNGNHSVEQAPPFKVENDT